MGNKNSATFYKHNNYDTPYNTLQFGMYRDVTKHGIDNDAISSLKVGEGTRVSLYEHNDFGGNLLVYKGPTEISSLPSGWNDKVSSIKVVDMRIYHPLEMPNIQAVFYQANNYDRAHRFVSLKYGNYANVQDWKLDNDTLSSLKIKKDTEVVLYEDINYGGRGLVLQGPMEMPSMPNGWNDIVSSIKIRNTKVSGFVHSGVQSGSDIPTIGYLPAPVVVQPAQPAQLAPVVVQPVPIVRQMVVPVVAPAVAPVVAPIVAPVVAPIVKPVVKPEPKLGSPNEDPSASPDDDPAAAGPNVDADEYPEEETEERDPSADYLAVDVQIDPDSVEEPGTDYGKWGLIALLMFLFVVIISSLIYLAMSKSTPSQGVNNNSWE